MPNDDRKARNAAEAKYATVFRNSPDAISITDSETEKLLEVNDAFERITGFSRTEAVGRSAKELGIWVSPDDRDRVMDALQRDGRVSNFETRLRRKDGALVTVLLSAESVLLGQHESMIAIIRDISERKLMEERLHLSAQYQRTLLDNFPFFVWLKDEKSRLLAANIEYARVAKVASTSELEGKTDFDFFPHDLASKYVADDRAVMETGAPKYDEEMYVDENDQRHWMETWKAPLVVDGRTVGTVGYSRDITERKEYAEQLRKAHEFTEMVLNAIPDPVFAKDRDHRFKFVNDALCALLGQSRDTLLGKSDADFLPAEQVDVFWKQDDLVFAGSGELVNDETVTDASGNIRIIQTKKTMAGPDTLIGIIRDLTGMKQLEIAKDMAENARHAAESANVAKSVFLANMSHELRTPLNAILGFSSMMRRNPHLSESEAKNLDIINRSGEHLLALINDVLDMAKIDAGRLSLEIEAFDLGAMVRDVTDMMRLRAESKGLFLRVDQSSLFPRFIMGDEARLRQILVNLVGNAVKFTKTGGVTVRLNVKENARRHLLIEIEDTGPGIHPEDQERIFRPFEQLAEAVEQKGTGLGLTITRQFVQLMGGTIAVESAVGKGSLFRVDLPVEPVDQNAIPEPRHGDEGDVIGLEPGQPRYRILIAEDQPENTLLLERLMDELGLETKTVENGVQCVQAYQEWQPDLIWMDRRMPLMDGLEAAGRIRRLPGGRAVKIVAVTASAFKEQQDEMLAAGMDDFVRKPYRFSEIYDCLARQLGLKYVYRTAEEAQSADLAPTIEHAAALPTELRRELRIALEQLDHEHIGELLKQISEIDPDLGHLFSRFAARYDYQTILDAVGRIPAE